MPNSEKLSALAKDLSTDVPRSPREMIGGYVIAARTLDKCRAAVADTLAEYHYDCPLDNVFFDFTGITGDAFKEFVATGASDDEVATWIHQNAKDRERIEIIQWNNGLRDKRISEMEPKLQGFLEDYIPENVPTGRPVYVWFDVYDLEEGRL
ncbi:MAG: DUF5069 domain-containing protein [Chthoniobacterales bacterium]